MHVDVHGSEPPRVPAVTRPQLNHNGLLTSALRNNDVLYVVAANPGGSMLRTQLAPNRVHGYPTYFETLAIPGASRLSAWIAAGLVAVGTALAGFLHSHEPVLIGTFTLLGACIAIVPVTMKAIYAILGSACPRFSSQGRIDPRRNSATVRSRIAAIQLIEHCLLGWNRLFSGRSGGFLAWWCG